MGPKRSVKIVAREEEFAGVTNEEFGTWLKKQRAANGSTIIPGTAYFISGKRTTLTTKPCWPDLLQGDQFVFPVDFDYPAVNARLNHKAVIYINLSTQRVTFYDSNTRADTWTAVRCSFVQHAARVFEKRGHMVDFSSTRTYIPSRYFNFLWFLFVPVAFLISRPF